MKEAVYIETSVISYCTSRTSRDLIMAARQAITLDWWESKLKLYNVYVSPVVEREISAGDKDAARKRLNLILEIPALHVTTEAEKLAEGLLAAQLLPAGSVDDALHIALASAHGMDYLLTWNFKHINNAETKNKIFFFIQDFGYACPVLCSPEELGVNK